MTQPHEASSHLAPARNFHNGGVGTTVPVTFRPATFAVGQTQPSLRPCMMTVLVCEAFLGDVCLSALAFLHGLLLRSSIPHPVRCRPKASTLQDLIAHAEAYKSIMVPSADV